MEVLLKAYGLCKVYGERKSLGTPVLKDINLEIREGEFVSIMGASGSGKSTLLYALSGMDQPTSGTASFCGSDYNSCSDDQLTALRLNQMGFIFQQMYLLKNLSVLDNIMLPAFHAKKESRQKIRMTAQNLMEQVGIWQLRDRDISEVSGGQLQRAAICRALINRPKAVFADEPTGALNSKASSDIMDILCRINQEGTTILLVTHDPKIAARTKRVLCLKDGMIHADVNLSSCDTSADPSIRENHLNEVLSKLEI